MNREKALLKNTAILAIGRLSSKVFTFLLLPLYTAVLLPTDYGTVDALQTVISLLLYFVTLQLESAIFRFLIECRDEQEKTDSYTATALLLLLANSSLFTVAVLLVNQFLPIPHLALFILSMWAQGFSFLMLNIARGRGQNVMYSLCSFIITIVALVVNLVLILGMNIGASSILAAVAISNFVGGAVIFIYFRLWTALDYRKFSREKMKEMLSYSLPLIPNAISWWIANTSDRIIILAFLGSAANGIYAAANKIPTIYSTIFGVYNLAWSESVALAIKDADCSAYINNMMRRSLRIFSFLGLGIISCMSLFFNFLIGANYVESYNHIYILLVAIFVNSMCSLYGGIFSGFKNSAIIGKTTVVGAAVNFAINILLVKFFGLYAASVSTLVSYIAIWIMRRRAVKAYAEIRQSKSDLIQCAIALCVVSAGYFSRIYLLNLGILAALIIWGCIINREMIGPFFDAIQKKIKR